MNNRNLKPGDLCLVLPCQEDWQPIVGKTVTLVRVNYMCAFSTSETCPHWEIKKSAEVALGHQILMKISGGDEVKDLSEETLQELINEHS